MWSVLSDAIEKRDPLLITFILQKNNFIVCKELPFVKIKELGKGEYGTVFSALLNRKAVAIKEEILHIKPKCQLKNNTYVCNSFDTSVIPEIIASYWLDQNPDPAREWNTARIESYFSCMEDKTMSVFLVMELYDGTLREFWTSLTEENKSNIALQLYYVILYFGRIGLHYIDIHPRNILIKKLEYPLTITYREGKVKGIEYLVKCSDFGISEIEGLLSREGGEDIDLTYRPDFDKMIRMLFYLENGGLEEPNLLENYFPTCFGRKISRFVYQYEKGKVTKQDFVDTFSLT